MREARVEAQSPLIAAQAELLSQGIKRGAELTDWIHPLNVFIFVEQQSPVGQEVLDALYQKLGLAGARLEAREEALTAIDDDRKIGHSYEFERPDGLVFREKHVDTELGDVVSLEVWR